LNANDLPNHNSGSAPIAVDRPGSATTAPAPAAELAFRPASGLEDAEAFTRRLAGEHYENFPVVSRLLPRRFRQDFCNIYSFCRLADDLADEVGDPALSLVYLERFRSAVRDCFAGRAEAATFVALSTTIRRHDIPAQPFLDLIDAFEQDQRVRRYENHEQLVAYCRRSADPVGRLVLYVCGYRDDVRQHLSDAVCTGLQLTNFWQDVRRDLTERDRIYIPRDQMLAAGVTEESLRAGRADASYRAMILALVGQTEAYFAQGEALLPLLRREVRGHIALFTAGGRAILEAIRRQGGDTLSRRPSLSAWGKSRLVIHALAAAAVARLTSGAAR
jgi:squalene synthase HpnC